MPAFDDLNLLTPESFHSIFELSDAGVAILDRKGKVCYCNSKSVQLWQEPGLEGKNVLDLLPREFGLNFLLAIRKVIVTRTALQGETQARVNGDVLSFRYNLQPLVSQAGTVERVLFSAIDITEALARQAREAEQKQEQEKFLAAALSLPGALITIKRRPDGRLYLDYASSSAEDVLGLNLSELKADVGPALERLQRADIKRIWAGAQSAVLNQQPWRGEVIYQHPQRGETWLELQIGPALGPDGEPIWHGYVQDVSERKKRDRALQRYQLISSYTRDIVLLLEQSSGKILDANAAAQSAYGYAYQELLSMRIQDLRFDKVDIIRQQMTEASQKGALFEAVHIRKDGSTFPVEVSSQGANIEGQNTLISIIRDISERRNLHHQLVESEEKFSKAFDTSPLAMAITEPERSVYVDVNLAFVNQLGYTYEEVIGHTPLELNIFPDLAKRAEVVRTLQREGRLDRTEIPIRTRWGEIRHGLFSAAMLELNGRHLLLTIMEDVTIQKRAEDALLKSQANMQALIENSEAAIWSVDCDCNLIIGNSIFGKMAQAVLGRPIQPGDSVLDLPLHRPDQSTWKDLYRRTQAGETLRVELDHVHPGPAHIIEYNLKPIYSQSGEVTGVTVYGKDITEQRRMEDAVRKSEAHFRALTEKSPMVVVLLDAELKIVYSSPNARTVLGYQSDERKGQGAFEMICPEDLPKIQAAMMQVYQKPGASAYAEFRGKHRDGSLRWLEGTATNLLADPDVQGIVINFSDIGERYAARQALEESEARYRTIFEGAQEGLVVMRIADRVFQYANPAICAMFGYSQAEFLQLSLADLHPGWELEHVFSEAERMRKTNKANTLSIACKRKDGSLFYSDIAASQVDIRGELHLVGFFTDVTERRRNDQLQRARLMLEKLPKETAPEDVLQETLDQAEMITGSTIGFFHFIEADQTSIWLQNWSTNTIENMCTAEGKGSHYPVEQAGVWADSLRTGKAVIYNDYASLPNLRGLPEGHAPVERLISVPVERDGQIVAIIGVGNKPVKYTDQDVEVVELLANEAWDIILNRRIEQALLESESKYRTLVESHDSLIATVDIEGRVYFMNKNAAGSINLLPEQAIGKNLTELFEPETAGRYLAEIRQVIVSGRRLTQEEQALVDGRQVWWRTNIEPIYDSANYVRLAMVNSVDITLRKETERVLEEMVAERTAEIEAIRQRLELATHAAGIGIWEWDVKTDKLTWDEQMLALFGVRREDFDGSNDFWRSRLHPDDLPTPNKPLMGFFVNGKSDSQFRVVWPDQSIHYIHSNALLLVDENNQPRQVIGIDYDITAQAQAERVLRSSEEMLRQANHELERAIRMKDEFLASMSHELRTPLTGILGLSEALQMDTYGSLNERQRKALGLVESSGRHLLELITDILDVSKVEAGKLDLEIETGSLGDVCQSSIQLVKGMLQKKRQHVQFSMDPAFISISGDMRRLKQILVNLLSNAVKFTPEDGRLGLEVRALEAEHSVRLTVWDEGIGISEADIGRLFQPFVQLDSRLSRQYSGTGLGLTLVKRLVELHQGRVEIASVVGKGSRFSVFLPWAGSPPGRGAAHDLETAGPAQDTLGPGLAHLSRVLTVDDSPEDAEFCGNTAAFWACSRKNCCMARGWWNR